MVRIKKNLEVCFVRQKNNYFMRALTMHVLTLEEECSGSELFTCHHLIY